MNNDNSSNITGTDLVTRLVNVLVNEVLLQVNQQINQEMIALSNGYTLLKDRVQTLEVMKDRVRTLEGKLALETDANEDGTLADRIKSLGSLAERVRTLEERLEDTVTSDELRDLERTVENAVDELPSAREIRDLRDQVAQMESDMEDLDSKVDNVPDEDRVEEMIHSVLEDADLTVQVKAALDSLTLEQAEELVRTGLKSLVSKAENLNQI